MKAIINCTESNLGWAKEFFGDYNLYFLQVAGKPLIEYYLDICSNLKIDELLILDSNYSKTMELFLGGGEKWVLKISYEGGNFDFNYDAMLKRRAQFAENAEILIFNGLFLPDFDIRDLNNESAKYLDLEKPEASPGIFLRNSDSDYRLEGKLFMIDSLQAFFRANLLVLNQESDFFILPGYKVENQVYSGMNVEISPGCELVPPLILGNNVKIGENVKLIGPLAISSNSIVEHDTVISNSIVLSGTYIGENLEIIDKIVCYDTIIDVPNEVALRNTEQILTGRMSRLLSVSRIFGMFLEYIFGVLLFLLQSVPWLFFISIIGVASKRKIMVILPGGGSFIYHCNYPTNGRILYFMKFSLDKYLLLWQMILGKVHLIGAHMPMEKVDDDDTLVVPSGCKLGVFCFSESFNINKNEMLEELDDRYFKSNYSAFLAIKTALKALFLRLFIGKKLG